MVKGIYGFFKRMVFFVKEKLIFQLSILALLLLMFMCAIIMLGYF